MMETLKPGLRSTSLDIISSSLVLTDGGEYAIALVGDRRRLAVLLPAGHAAFKRFTGERIDMGDMCLLVGDMTPSNAIALRQQIPWLRPQILGLRTSAGMGDRLGLATPGHIHALRAAGGKIAPIFAQQSMREMARTRRTPQQVMDDAMWAVFAEGWRGGAGADADHLKTPDDIDVCLAAGFTFFTIDPGVYVDNRAEAAERATLLELVAALPQQIQPARSELLNRTFDLETGLIRIDEPTLLRATVKYGNAILHVADMYEHLAARARSRPFELEVSLDETDQPTTHAEHIYIASELRRMGVQWVSLAPRFVGRFEKGVDYIGDLQAFEADVAGHAEVARALGPYKLSIHSGSDKFSIYGAAVRETRGLVHLKTAGTSYLEALRTIAESKPDFLHSIYEFARSRYEVDRASYHVSAEISRAPDPAEVRDWVGLLDQFDAREILHVTFGSVLTEVDADGRAVFYDGLMQLLRAYPEEYAANLERHFTRHLLPFAATEGS